MNPLLAGAFLAALIHPAPPLAPGVPPRGAPALRSWQPAGAPRAVWPLDPRPQVVEGFVAPSSQWSAGHRGVDLLGRTGAAVRASMAGTVIFAGTVAGRGVVVLDHGAFRTTYEPVSSTVAPGEQVGAGDVIGVLQSAQSHCTPRVCLHWGLLQDGDYRDPLTLLGATRVRLLPLGDQARG